MRNALDEWGRDPGIRHMRQVFSVMETVQEKIFSALGLSPFDPRLRSWRDRARAVFEQTWSREIGAGRQPDLGEVYSHCVYQVLQDDGLDVARSSIAEERR